MIGMPSDLRLCDFAITLPREPIDTGTVLIEGRSRNTPQLHSATHQPPQSPPRNAGSGTRIRRTVRGQGIGPPHVRGVKRRMRGRTGDRPGHQARFSNGPRCSRSPYGGRFLENSTVDMRLPAARASGGRRVPLWHTEAEIDSAGVPLYVLADEHTHTLPMVCVRALTP